MKRIFTLIAFSLVLGIATQATNRALLVAIDSYAPDTKWNEIHATNDVKLIKPELVKHGFKETNIKVLENRNATFAAIVNAINTLTDSCQKGDIVYLHFSCHGQLMDDITGRESDGFAEALVPYDACKEPSNTYKGQNHLLDSKLASLLEALRVKLGKKGRLLVVLDACHSDGAYVVRGGNSPSLRGTDKVFTRGDASNKSAKKVRTRPYPTGKAKGQAQQIVIFACQSGQQCGEMYRQKPERMSNINGTLSLAVFKAIECQKAGTFDIKKIADKTVSESIILQKKQRKQTIGYNQVN